MTPLEEPAFSNELWTEEAKYACEYPLDENLIVVNIKLRNRAPEIVEFFGAYHHETEQLDELLLYMQDNNAEAPEAAIWFLKNYESVWTEWVPADIAQKVKSALP